MADKKYDLNTKEGRKGYDNVVKEREKLYQKQKELIGKIDNLSSDLKKYSY